MHRKNGLNLMRRGLSSLTGTVSQRQHSTRPRVAIVGSGPAGFYAAQYLLKNIKDAKVDMYEKYPVPFGLVRFGVAPDHPEVKNVIHSFTTTAKTENFSFLGGVTVGSTITVQELLSHYHAVILAYGASKDRLLNVPGEEGKSVYSAREIVGWYNGLPEDCRLQPDLSHSSAVIIGQGNVAIDVARILLTSPNSLEKTDITQYALETLRHSRIRDVHLVGRRGPAQVAFTIKEFRELTKLPDVNIVLDEVDVEDIRGRIAKFPKQRRRLMELLVNTAGRPPVDSAKNCFLKFLSTPKKIVRSDERIEAVNFVTNKLQDPAEISSGVVPTNAMSIIKCSTVIRSIGYEAVPVCSSVPFDPSKSVIPNDCGRVENITGLYCSGWVKRGPVGVILTTMNDAYETVDTLLEDVNSGRLNLSEKKPNSRQISDILLSRNCDPVTFDQWELIDNEEVRRGEAKMKPREKIVDVREMLSIAKGITLANKNGQRRR